MGEIDRLAKCATTQDDRLQNQRRRPGVEVYFETAPQGGTVVQDRLLRQPGQ
jgi:hypothetical protein